MGSAGGTFRSLRRRAAPAAKSALLRLGGYSVLRTLVPSRKVAILRYHAICGEEGHTYAAPGICISREAFAAHVQYLAANYTVLALPDVTARLRDRRPLPANAVAITFDDGYADNLEAARVLAANGLTATFYITAGCLKGGEPFWPSEVRLLVARLPEGLLRLQAAGRAHELQVGPDSASRERCIRDVTRLLKSHTIPERERLRVQLRDAAGNPDLPCPMLTWDELAAVQRLGMTVGAHTVTHPNLPSAGLEAARGEIVGSRQRLERELGSDVTMFSYPNGGADRYFTPEIQRVVAEAGYAAATTSRNGFAGPESDLYELERIEVEERLEDLVFALEVERFAFQPEGGRPTAASVSRETA